MADRVVAARGIVPTSNPRQSRPDFGHNSTLDERLCSGPPAGPVASFRTSTTLPPVPPDATKITSRTAAAGRSAQTRIASFELQAVQRECSKVVELWCGSRSCRRSRVSSSRPLRGSCRSCPSPILRPPSENGVDRLLPRQRALHRLRRGRRDRRQLDARVVPHNNRSFGMDRRMSSSTRCPREGCRLTV